VSRVRGLLERVQKLERRQTRGPSPIELLYGSFDAFEVKTQKEIDEGKLCKVDAPVIIDILRSWHATGVKMGRGRRGE
jgi:hypothetical protein